MKKRFKAASIGLVVAVLIGSINLSFGIVGIPEPNSENQSEQESESSDSDLLLSGEIDNSSENNSDPINIYSNNDNLQYDPEDFQSEDEESELNKTNKSLLENLQDSIEENPGGSLVKDDYAYYKVGGLSEQPETKAPVVILMDANSGFVLYNKNATEQKYPASMTKVMTALVAIENGNLDDTITFSENAVESIPDDATVAGFSVGDQITLREAIYGLFMASGADCAIAIAEYIGGDVDSFVEMMNVKAEQLGCANTHFTNPHGLHDAQHYTSAYDMALIMKEAIMYDEFIELIGEKSCTVNQGVREEIKMQNRSALLSEGNKNYYEYAKGSKTGHTDAAKYTLVSFAERDNETLICVVMGEESFDDSYADSKKLYEWGYKKTQILTPLPDASSIENTLRDAMTSDKFDKIKCLSLKYIPEYGILTNTAINKDAVRSFFVMDEDKDNGILGYMYVTYYEKILIGKTPVLYEINDDGYKQYMSYYEKPTISTGSSSSSTLPSTVPSNTTEPDENSSGVVIIDDNGEENNVDPIYDDIGSQSTAEKSAKDIFSIVTTSVLVYLLSMVVLCMVSYIIILIKRKKNQ